MFVFDWDMPSQLFVVERLLLLVIVLQCEYLHDGPFFRCYKIDIFQLRII